MREPKLSQTQVSMLPIYDAKEALRDDPTAAQDDVGSETKLRAMRTICLADCSIPE
jgi:hypothetical protein